MLYAVTISGSYRKFIEEIEKDRQEFLDRGVRVLSPPSTRIVGIDTEFVSLAGDPVTNISGLGSFSIDDAIRQVENSHLKAIQDSDALWISMPTGYCGAATLAEIFWSVAHGVPAYARKEHLASCHEPLARAYVQPVTSIASLVKSYNPLTKNTPLQSASRRISQCHGLSTQPKRSTRASNETKIAVGAIIVDYSQRVRSRQPRDILVVKTHKWNGKYSIVGGTAQPEEQLGAALQREITTQTRLTTRRGGFVCAFEKLPASGYYQPNARRLYFDHVVPSHSRCIELNDAAEEYLWLPPKETLTQIPLEPNARKTIVAYVRKYGRWV